MTREGGALAGWERERAAWQRRVDAWLKDLEEKARRHR
jgi:hypothetical protein